MIPWLDKINFTLWTQRLKDVFKNIFKIFDPWNVFWMFHAHRVTRCIYYSDIPQIETFTNHIWWYQNSPKLLYLS